MRRTLPSPVALLAAAALALVGCDKARAPAATADACLGCHGDVANGNAAPPRSVRGATATADRAVGAHQAHLASGVACAECHVVPTSVADHLHTVDGQATVTFGPVATAKGTPAAWDPAKGTCATYCHGATLAGGAATTPVWTQVDGTQRACGACHGAPPSVSSGHPAAGSDPAGCAACHPDTVRPDGTIDVARGKHVNGAVDVGALGCAACHGDPARAANPAAPPKGTQGETATTARAVGAHQSHLAAGAVYGPVACGECHVVPTDTAHVDGVARVTFGALSRTGGAAASWDGATCAVYCHGATLAAGGANTAPAWTKVDGTQAACGTCHAVPPPPSSGHPAVSAALTGCVACHPATMNADGTVNVAGGKHIDGQVEAAGGSCNSCHGGAQNNAPPKGTHGETLTTDLAVGAHQSHVTGTALRSAPLACSECHVVPDGTKPHPSGTLDLTFGALARTAGATPGFSAASATCSGVYCHGATLAAGGSTTAPVWTRVDGTQIRCTSCHGAPPPAPHVQSSACGSCHTGYTSTSVNPALHLNGIVDAPSLTCTSCHGTSGRAGVAGADANVAAAPPVDTKGNTATTARGVGVHLAHVSQATWRSAPLGCADCHAGGVPTSMTHANGTVQFAFGALASSAWGGVTPAPAWNTSNLTCAGTYCHGNFKNGANATVGWTTAGGVACGSCHAIPPGGGHTTSTACGSCHTGYTSTSVNKALHMNGALDVASLSCTSCHGTAGRVGVAGADANLAAAPPVDTKGNTATTARGVGVHQQHVNQATYRTAPIACSECHFNAVPTSTTHSNGTVQFAFGTLARNASWGGVTPSPTWNTTNLTCAGTYCHGSFKNGAGAAPSWTAAGALGCTSCHGNPPGGTHPANASCGNCHTGYTNTSVNKATHLNGALDVTNLTCTSCHGTSGATATAASPLAAAPPVDSTGAATGIRVGAHPKHLAGSSATRTYSNGFACQTCHANVASYTTTHANGTADVGFTGAPAGLTGGTVTPRSGSTAATCSNTACHAVKDRNGASSGGATPTPSWSATITGCTACHGSPPGTGRHGINSSHQTCANCHSGYTSSAVNLTLHVNGARDVGGTGTSINSWNSGTRSCSPSCHGSQTW